MSHLTNATAFQENERRNPLSDNLDHKGFINALELKYGGYKYMYEYRKIVCVSCTRVWVQVPSTTYLTYMQLRIE